MSETAAAEHSRPGSAQLADLARELGRSDRDWAILAEGNCSASTANQVVLVKASGVEMHRAVPADFVEVSRPDLLELIDDAAACDDDVAALFDAVAKLHHGRRPSVEALLHAVCLDMPGITVVGHTHPVPVNAILCSSQPTLLSDGALFPDQIVVLGATPLFVPYFDPGLRLAQHVRQLLRERRDDPPRAIYLQNHGMFALGNSPTQVLQITEMAVKVARVALGAHSLGHAAYMSDKDVDRIDTRPDELHRRTVLADTPPTGPSRQ